jgi:hypothetical protein
MTKSKKMVAFMGSPNGSWPERFTKYKINYASVAGVMIRTGAVNCLLRAETDTARLLWQNEIETRIWATEHKTTDVKRTHSAALSLIESFVFTRSDLHMDVLTLQADLTPSDVQLSAMKGLLGHRDVATAVLVQHRTRQMAEWCCF